MKRIQITNTCRADVTEVWTVDVPDNVEADADNFRDVIGNHHVVAVANVDIANEDERKFISVERIS